MSNQKFEGAVTGKEGSYKDRTLLLENRCEVFFHIEGEQIYVDQTPEGAEAGIWYIEQREEYAVQPAKTSTVYLKSGQPLGKNRIYYLPRGMQIWIASRKNSFLLE